MMIRGLPKVVFLETPRRRRALSQLLMKRGGRRAQAGHFQLPLAVSSAAGFQFRHCCSELMGTSPHNYS